MGEKHYVELQSCRTVIIRFLRFGNLSCPNCWISTITQSPEYRDLDRIDGEPVVFEWKNVPRHTTLQLLREIQRTMEEKKVFVGRKGRKRRHLYVEIFKCCCVRQKISERTLVIPRTRKWRKVVRNAHSQTKRFVEMLPIWWCLISEKADILFSEETSALLRGLCKAKEVEDHRYATTQIQRQQSCYFAQLFPSISSVSTEQWRIGVKNLLSGFQIILHLVQGTLLPRGTKKSKSRVAPMVVSILTNSLPGAATQRKIRKPSSRHSSE